jgi:hypothetical protein
MHHLEFRIDGFISQAQTLQILEFYVKLSLILNQFLRIQHHVQLGNRRLVT